MSYYHVNDHFSKAWGVDGDLNWLVIYHLCEPIDDDKDWVVSVSFSICQNW